MDKVSQLLKEARPLYIKQQREKKAFLGLMCSLCLIFGVWLAQPKTIAFDEDGFDSYFTALYMNDGGYDDFVDDGVVPLDQYGLIEV